MGFLVYLCLYSFLALVLYMNYNLHSPDTLPPKTNPVTPWTGDWVSPDSGRSSPRRDHSFFYLGIRTMERPSCSLLAVTTLPRILIDERIILKYSLKGRRENWVRVALYRKKLSGILCKWSQIVSFHKKRWKLSTSKAGLYIKWKISTWNQFG